MSQDLIFGTITVFVLLGFGFVIARGLKRFPRARVVADSAVATVQLAIAASAVAEENASVVVTTKKKADRPKPGHVRILGKHGRGTPREVEFVGADVTRGVVSVKFPGDPKVHHRSLAEVRAV